MSLKVVDRIKLGVACISLIAALPFVLLTDFTLFESVMLVGVFVIFIQVLTHFIFKDIAEGLGALEVGLLNLKDGEFSTSINYRNNDELSYLCSLYNETIEHLRQEKQWLYQRELLLDKITQGSPEVLFLVNDQQQIIFSNIASRRFFHRPQGLDGQTLSDVLSSAPSGVQSTIDSQKEGLFSVHSEGGETQTWHLSIGQFLLNNQHHRLYILKQMTREISRQEVAVWKKVIRVISHELNNSLGPISSMLHSGKIVSEKLEEERLSRVFSTIDERIKHLSEFVQGYGKFAKIPEPKIVPLSSRTTLKRLAQQWAFDFDEKQDTLIHADPSQLEQLLINLLKNAHESGSSSADIQVQVRTLSHKKETLIEVSDAGKGIDDASLSSVLIPFYSTKSNGTGLGLALCREIVEAHHGNIALHNRVEGGLSVRVSFPDLRASSE